MLYVYAAAGLAVLAFAAWYLRRMLAMRAARGVSHLIEISHGLQALRRTLPSGSAAEAEHPAAPRSVETSRGTMLAWSASRTDGGYEHTLSLFSGWETWWLNGFLMAFVCDRLGLPLRDASVFRTPFATAHLSVVLTDSQHADLMERTIELPDPREPRLLLARVEAVLVDLPPPPYADRPPEELGASAPVWHALELGVHGLELGRWSSARVAKRLREFEEAGPAYAVPHRATHCVEGIPACVGTLYAALYPRDRFRDLLDFDLFQRYSASIQQDLIRTGELDRRWFHPTPHAALASRYSERLDSMSAAPDVPDVAATIERMDLPDAARWVLDLGFSAWTVEWDIQGLELVAETDEGYLTLFTVDDALGDHDTEFDWETVPVERGEPYGPLDPALLTAFERRLPGPLPRDLRAFLAEFNGARFVEPGEEDDDADEPQLRTVYGLHVGPPHLRMHESPEGFRGLVPATILVFGSDGCGNYFGISLADADFGEAYFIHHESLPTDRSSMTRVAGSFAELVPRDASARAHKPSVPTSLREAIESGRPAAVRRMIDAGTDVGGGVHRAVVHGDLRMLQVVLECGGDPNERGAIGGTETPLFVAARRARADMVELLIRFGADPNIRCGAGGTVLQMAKHKPDVIDVLRRAGARE